MWDEAHRRGCHLVNETSRGRCFVASPYATKPRVWKCAPSSQQSNPRATVSSSRSRFSTACSESHSCVGKGGKGRNTSRVLSYSSACLFCSVVGQGSLKSPRRLRAKARISGDVMAFRDSPWDSWSSARQFSAYFCCAPLNGGSPKLRIDVCTNFLFSGRASFEELDTSVDTSVDWLSPSDTGARWTPYRGACFFR
jgi:hypothetical protein